MASCPTSVTYSIVMISDANVQIDLLWQIGSRASGVAAQILQTQTINVPRKSRRISLASVCVLSWRPWSRLKECKCNTKDGEAYLYPQVIFSPVYVVLFCVWRVFCLFIVTVCPVCCTTPLQDKTRLCIATGMSCTRIGLQVLFAQVQIYIVQLLTTLMYPCQMKEECESVYTWYD